MNWNQLLSQDRNGQSNPPGENSRTTFEQDFDRIIFSHPFRRLQDKTQVHPLPEHDFVHTRLTHSLEVSSVARSLGRTAGETILARYPELKVSFSSFDFGAITAAAALAHDLGNPPFGHAGEDALADFFSTTEYGRHFREQVSEAEWKDLTRFEGNAQGFRIINSGSYGLKLTAATRGAFTKYPCSADLDDRHKNRKSQKKFGFFTSEKATFETLATQLGLHRLSPKSWVRHPLAFLVEAADDICYSIIDLEDGCRLGLVSFEDTAELLADILREDFRRDKLERNRGQNEKVAVLRAMAIGKLVTQCTQVFLDNERDILEGEFDQALADFTPSKKTLDAISAISVEKIYRARHVVEIEASGHEILPGLLHELLRAGQFLQEQASKNGAKIPRKYANLAMLFPPETTVSIKSGTGVYHLIRNTLDFVSGMTDKHALSLYRKIKGISL